MHAELCRVICTVNSIPDPASAVASSPPWRAQGAFLIRDMRHSVNIYTANAEIDIYHRRSAFLDWVQHHELSRA